MVLVVVPEKCPALMPTRTKRVVETTVLQRVEPLFVTSYPVRVEVKNTRRRGLDTVFPSALIIFTALSQPNDTSSSCITCEIFVFLFESFRCHASTIGKRSASQTCAITESRAEDKVNKQGLPATSGMPHDQERTSDTWV